MKRILFITNSLTGGGAERAINLVANEMVKAGWATALIPINAGDKDLVELNCEVFSLNRPWRGGIIQTIRAFLKFMQVVKLWNPQILIVTCSLPELFACFSFGRHQIISVEEAKDPWGNHLRLGKLVRKILELRKTLWVGASEHLTIWPNGDQPDAVIKNSVVNVTLTESSENEELENPCLLFVGRLSPEKRPDWFLKICEGSHVSGHIFGSGLMQDGLIRQSSGQTNLLKFFGYVRDPWKLTSSSNLLIVPSATEGDGLIIIEALKAGLPILVSDIPELRHFQLPESHYCKNISDFVSKIQSCNNDFSQFRVEESLRNSIVSSRNPEVIGQKWQDFLLPLLRD